MGGAGRRIAHRRPLALGVLLLVIWVVVAAKLFEVQVVRADEWTERGLAQRITQEELAPRRGTIYDRTGQVLAFTIDATTVYANPGQLEDPVEASLAVAAALDQPFDVVAEKLARDASFVYLARQLEGEAAAAVAELDIPGIYTVPEPKRLYPAAGAAAHVVGFVDIDGTGLEGLEYHFDEELRGRPGFIQYEQANGVQIPHGREDRVDPVPGADLGTTIDLSLQFITDRACAATVERTDAKRCSIVVLEPESGEILALTVAPGYDPGDRSALEPERLQNIAVRSLYEPGSTMKILTIGAALEDGLIDPDTTFEVPAELEFYDEAIDRTWTFEDVDRTETEVLTVREIVTRSSNIGTILIEQELGFERHRDALTSWGFGSPVGIDLNGEARGSVNLDPTCVTCGPSVAIGYSVNTTLIQMASVFGAVANDGEWVTPHVVRRIDRAGEVDEPSVERRELVSPEVAATLRALLRNVVEDEEGTGVAARIAGYDVGGKTGTSRVFEDGEYHDDRFMASFIGMAPVDDPRLVVAVLVEEPQGKAYSGGTAAAPAFAEVMEKALQQLGIEPVQPEEEAGGADADEADADG